MGETLIIGIQRILTQKKSSCGCERSLLLSRDTKPLLAEEATISCITACSWSTAEAALKCMLYYG
jgi:hypothetical protein